MRSLRLRFFLIAWPLVVVAVAAVAYGFGRWTSQELRRYELKTFRTLGGEQITVEEKVFFQPEPRQGFEQRTRQVLWGGVLAASTAAAAAAWLLAGPLVSRVKRLEFAARRLAAGELSARVAEPHAMNPGDELDRLGASFNTMAAALERAEEQKRNLVSDVAHELRTPLTNLKGLLEAVTDGLRPADPATLASLSEEVDLLAQLIDELQELALAESGQLRFELETFDAVAAANTAVEACRGLTRGQVLAGPKIAAPIQVVADRRRLAQVLRNLIKNALTYTAAGGEVVVEVEPRQNRVALLVRDTGRGIPPEHLSLIFERFHRVDPSRQRSSGGMGLGLAVVRQLVTGMGGTVEVESSEGKGSTFTVLLPESSGTFPAPNGGLDHRSHPTRG